MLRMILALIIALAVSLVGGPYLINYLRKLHFGQTIYELGPAHQQKQGTPIMGGLMFITGAVVCGLILHPARWVGGWDFMLAMILMSLLSMTTGFLDDFTKVTKKRNLGLTPIQKLGCQVLVALAFSVYCYYNPYVGSSIVVPFTHISWDLGFFYIPLMTLLIMFIINSANLQDGLDGLLGSVTCVGTVGWSVLALILAVVSQAAMNLMGLGYAPDGLQDMVAQYQSVSVFGMALVGGVLGYLRYNYYPAKVFMGDTGSMFIGGATVAMAMLLRMPILLIFMAFTMIVSSLSVMIQVGYFKYTKKKYGAGRRIFLMSPIHHHYEKKGMPETRIVAMYTAVAAVMTLIGLLSVLNF